MCTEQRGLLKIVKEGVGNWRLLVQESGTLRDSSTEFLRLVSGTGKVIFPSLSPFLMGHRVSPF